MGSLIAGCGIALTAVSAPVAAQHAGHGDHATVVAQGDAAPSQGEVRKVDKAAGKVTLKHGEIRNLGMPPMTMVFQVSDPAMLDRVKAGDKVKFVAEKQGAALVVVAIEPVK
jgi:Cu/Ag efflux protein CusF